MRRNHFSDNNFAATHTSNNSGDGTGEPVARRCSTGSSGEQVFPRRSAPGAWSQGRGRHSAPGYFALERDSRLIAVSSLKINSVAAALTANFRCLPRSL